MLPVVVTDAGTVPAAIAAPIEVSPPVDGSIVYMETSSEAAFAT